LTIVDFYWIFRFILFIKLFCNCKIYCVEMCYNSNWIISFTIFCQ